MDLNYLIILNNYLVFPQPTNLANLKKVLLSLKIMNLLLFKNLGKLKNRFSIVEGKKKIYIYLVDSFGENDSVERVE